MIVRRHVHLMDRAGLIIGTPSIRGLTLWRGRGLRTLRRMLGKYQALVQDLPIKHLPPPSPLAPRQPYEQVFGDYANTYTLTDDPHRMLRADNIVPNVGAAQKDAGPTSGRLSVSGLFRRFAGPVSPVFREVYIWPCTQIDQVVPEDRIPSTLSQHLEVLQEFFGWLGLETIAVRVDDFDHYGRESLLIVTALPGGSPTILATVYVLADHLHERLGLPDDHAAIDVGMTAKPLAVSVLVHDDERGLALASGPTDIQVLLMTGEHDDVSCWLDEMATAGIRVVLRRTGPNRTRRDRVERQAHAAGIPVVVGLGRDGFPDGARIATRHPLRRQSLAGLPGTADMQALLNANDARLRARSAGLMQRLTRQSEIALCESCSEKKGFVGELTPRRPAPCSLCAGPGRRVLKVESGRFY